MAAPSISGLGFLEAALVSIAFLAEVMASSYFFRPFCAMASSTQRTAASGLAVVSRCIREAASSNFLSLMSWRAVARSAFRFLTCAFSFRMPAFLALAFGECFCCSGGSFLM